LRIVLIDDLREGLEQPREFVCCCDAGSLKDAGYYRDEFTMRCDERPVHGRLSARFMNGVGDRCAAAEVSPHPKQVQRTAPRSER